MKKNKLISFCSGGGKSIKELQKMSPFIKRLSILAVFALVNSVLAFVLLDYFVVELKIWQYIVIETTIVAMHFLLGWIRTKVETTFPDEDEDEVV